MFQNFLHDVKHDEFAIVDNTVKPKIQGVDELMDIANEG